MNQLIQLVAGLPRTGTNACNNTLLKTGERKKKLYICIQLENKLVTCLSKSRMLGNSGRSMTFFQKSKICTSYQYFLFHQQ